MKTWFELAKMIKSDFSNVEFDGLSKEEFKKIFLPKMLRIVSGVARACYLETGNPLYVWEAIRFCTENQIQFAQWILNYLENASSNILDITDKKYTKESKENPEMIRDALDLNAGPGDDPFKSYLTVEKQIETFLLAPKIKRAIKRGEIEKLRAQSVNEIIGAEVDLGEENVKKIRNNKTLKKLLLGIETT